jgi:hypothetical protein
MSKADEFRAKARLCAERAAAQCDWDIKQSFLALEENWIYLDEWTEQRAFFEHPIVPVDHSRNLSRG